MKCARLNASMHGTWEVATNWHEHRRQQFFGLGFTHGKASPCSFLRNRRDLEVLVHDDGHLVSAMEANLERLPTGMKKHHECTAQMFAFGPEGEKVVRCWTDW